jgi:hypothetical protein
MKPTSCAASLATESIFTGTATLPPSPGATQNVATPLPVSGCSGLDFSPAFTVATNSSTSSRAGGASLEVSLTPHPHQANIKEVAVTLPPQLVSRLTTLQKACTEAQFAAGPADCPAASQVATATLTTPLLPGRLGGRGYLVSHGGAAFPDLDFVLQGDGVTLIQESHTDIKGGISSSTFPSLPDAPFTSFTASFAVGPNSLLASNGSLCSRTVTSRRRVLVRKHGHAVRRQGHLVYRTREVTRRLALKLTTATTLVGQNGAKRSQRTPIKVRGCAKSAVRSARYMLPRVRVRGHVAFVTLAVPSGGRLSASGRDMQSVHRRIGRASTVTLKVPLSGVGASALAVRHRLRVSVHLTFAPAARHGKTLTALASAVFVRR